jgi:hypothetical protein
LLRSQTNGDHNAFKILHHIAISEPEHAVSAGRKPLVLSAVITKPGFEIVALAINFNNQLAGMRNEVGYVVAYWGLSPEPERGKSMRFQMAPQQRFSTRHRAS